MKEEIKRGYYSNGKISYEFPYKNGKEHGLSKHWQPNGQIMREAKYKDGIQSGIKVDFYFYY